MRKGGRERERGRKRDRQTVKSNGGCCRGKATAVGRAEVGEKYKDRERLRERQQHRERERQNYIV